MDNVNTINKLKELENSGKITEMEQLLSKGLMMPFNSCNSGSRKQMYGAEIEQKLDLLNPELPRVATGYENSFGDRSSSLIVTDDLYIVAHKISKFSFDPNRFYYLVIFNPNKNQFDILERKECEHITESYGIMYNTSYMDSLKEGSKILPNTTIRKSSSYDDYNNRMDGVNLMCTYITSEITKEDGYRISESAAKKLASPLIKKVQIQINDNDIPLNLYARNSNDYKSFPDLGESTESANGILCALRRQKKEEMLFTQSKQNLSKIMISDEKYTVDGFVSDIDVYCNNMDTLSEYYYFSQLKFYVEERMRFMQEFVDKVYPIINSNYECSYELKKTYSEFSKILSGGQYIKDNVFSNIIIELTIVEYNKAGIGDKITNRYAGKGVISSILPDEMMPLLDNGRRVDVMINSSTTINRENNGQLNEMFINFCTNRIRDHIENIIYDHNYVINLYIDFLNILDEELAKQMEEYILSFDVDEQIDFMKNVFDEGFIVSLNPIKNIVGVDKLLEIKRRFPFIKQYNVKVPQIGSDGKYRYVNTRRTMECGEQYFWRLKQYAEEKFSAVSLSATNLKNENARNNSKRSYKSPYAKTCIRFGNMETGDLLHLGTEAVITNLLLVSLSPKSRRRVGMTLTEGPIFDIDIKLEPGEKNRSVEILNAYLTTIGLKIEFVKVPKESRDILKYPNRFFNHPIRIINRACIVKDDDGYVYIPTIVENDDNDEKPRKMLKYREDLKRV